jgi:CRISPR/Cas system-associated protein Csx1
MWTRNKHKHTARRPHLQKGGRGQAHSSCRKDKKTNQMNLSEVQKKIEFLKGRNEYNTNNKYANDLTDRFLQLLGQREKSKGDP